MKNQTPVVKYKVKIIVSSIMLAFLLSYSTVAYSAYTLPTKAATPLTSIIPYQILAPFENSYLFLSISRESRAKKSLNLLSRRGDELRFALTKNNKTKLLSHTNSAVNNTKDFAIRTVNAINQVSNTQNREALTELYGQTVFNLISHLMPFQHQYSNITALVKSLFGSITYFSETAQVRLLDKNEQIIFDIRWNYPKEFEEIIDDLPDNIKKRIKFLDKDGGGETDDKRDTEGEDGDDNRDNGDGNNDNGKDNNGDNGDNKDGDGEDGKIDDPVVDSLSKAIQTLYSLSPNTFIIKHVRVLNAHNLYRLSLIFEDENYLIIILKKNGARYEEVFTSTEMDWGGVTRPNDIDLTGEEWSWLIDYVPVNDNELEPQYKQ